MARVKNAVAGEGMTTKEKADSTSSAVAENPRKTLSA
jgi:hypothetical protein